MRAILTWHSVDRSGSVISVSPEELAEQFEWLERSGARVQSVPNLLAGTGGGPAVALTFDDGFANFTTEVLPALERRGWPATLFVVSGRVGATNRWEGSTLRRAVPCLPLLGWTALRELPSHLVEVGAHTRSHPRLDAVADQGRLEEELGGCAEELADRLGKRPAILAYPFGASSPQVRAVAARHFRWSCSTSLRTVGPHEDPHNLPRVDAWYLRRPALVGPWGSPRCMAYLTVRAAARRARRFLTARGGG